MPNGHFLVKFCKCQKAVSILPHEAKALLELFWLQPILFGHKGKIAPVVLLPHEAKYKYMILPWWVLDWIGLVIFKNFADQDWIGFNFIGSGLDSH